MQQKCSGPDLTILLVCLYNSFVMKVYKVRPGLYRDEKGRVFFSPAMVARLVGAPSRTISRYLERGMFPSRRLRGLSGPYTHLVEPETVLEIACHVRADVCAVGEKLKPLVGWNDDDMFRYIFKVLGADWEEIKRRMQEEPERFI